MFVLILAMCAVSALAQADNANENAAAATEDQSGFADKFKDVWSKITQVVGTSSVVCNNGFVKGGSLTKALCGDLVPKEITDRIGLKDGFGPTTAWCGGLSCAFRALGCKEATYEVESLIIKATGSEESCLGRVGLDPDHCLTLAKYISTVPLQQQGRKRVEVEAPKKIEKEEISDDLMRAGKMLIRSMYPDLAAEKNNFGLGEHETWESHLAKREGATDALLAQAQICNPLIGTIVDLVQQQFNLPVNISSLFGPCGTACEYAVCGLQLICGGPDHLGADPILSHVNSQRDLYCKERPLSCAKWEDKPIDKCKGVTCVASNGDYPDGYFNKETNCLPPKRIHTPTRAAANDCCSRCEDFCAINQVRCNPVQCNAPQWPSCTPQTVGRFHELDCCDICIDPCEGIQCATPPESCGPGQILGPRTIGDCCLTCVSPCQGVSCKDAPRSQSDCPDGTTWAEPIDRSLFETMNPSEARCEMCCNRCVGVADSAIEEGAAAAVAAGAAAAVAAVASSTL